MKNKPYFLAILLATIIGGGVLVALSATTPPPEPSEPYALITWQGKSYVPSNFKGKILPSANSNITASLEVFFKEKSGVVRPADLSKQTVYWYLNDDFLAGGLGTQSVSFKAGDSAGTSLDLRAQIEDFTYSGISYGLVIKSITIPIGQPQVVIVAPYPNKELLGPNVSVKAEPYFFSVKDLSGLRFSWEANGEKPTGGEPERLNIGFSETPERDSGLDIQVTIENIKNALEAASGLMLLIFK